MIVEFCLALFCFNCLNLANKTKQTCNSVSPQNTVWIITSPLVAWILSVSDCHTLRPSSAPPLQRKGVVCPFFEGSQLLLHLDSQGSLSKNNESSGPPSPTNQLNQRLWEWAPGNRTLLKAPQAELLMSIQEWEPWTEAFTDLTV